MMVTRTYAAEAKQFIPIQMYPTLTDPIMCRPELTISRPVVWSTVADHTEDMSAQAAMTDEPTMSANEHRVRPVTDPLNMNTSP